MINAIKEFKSEVKYCWKAFNFKEWSFGGQPLLPPLTIARRLLFIIPLITFKHIFLFTYAAGWSVDDMKRMKKWME